MTHVESGIGDCFGPVTFDKYHFLGFAFISLQYKYLNVVEKSINTVRYKEKEKQNRIKIRELIASLERDQEQNSKIQGRLKIQSWL